MLKLAIIDHGAAIGIAISRRRAFRVRNPFAMNLARIFALDLRK